MASLNSSFNCLSSSHSTRSSSPFPPPTQVRFHAPRPISASCAAAATAPESSATFYDVLGVPNGANFHEIKSAYRSLARVLHPDVVANNGQHDVVSADDFIRVHEAYATLSDPRKRADYDRALFIRRRFVEGPSRFTRRSWETDQCW